MHLGGRFANRVYDSLKECHPDVASRQYVEELLRVTGLLHDVGHGPFGHFFDHEFLLPKYRITHEDLGQRIIEKYFSSQIREIRRSPSGLFGTDERLDPNYVSYLINKQAKPKNMPQWVQKLKPLLTGIYTIDNLDYVSRDSYACGLSTGSLFVDRLLHYSFVTEGGLTLHQRGIEALKMFLTIKAYLFSNVYFHRTVRAFDLHLREIFRPTLELIVRRDPRRDLESYLHLTDHTLFAQVREWEGSHSQTRRRLAAEWAALLSRTKKWIFVCGDVMPFLESLGLTRPLTAKDVKRRMRRYVPRRIRFNVEVSTHDPRPDNLTNMGQEQFYVYEEGRSPQVNKATLEDHFRGVASLVVLCRVYAEDRKNRIISRLA
jgi:hypothetical protein